MFTSPVDQAIGGKYCGMFTFVCRVLVYYLHTSKNELCEHGGVHYQGIVVMLQLKRYPNPGPVIGARYRAV